MVAFWKRFILHAFIFTKCIVWCAGMKATELGGCFWEAFEPAEMSQRAIESQGSSESSTGFVATLKRHGVEHKALFR